MFYQEMGATEAHPPKALSEEPEDHHDSGPMAARFKFEHKLNTLNF